MKKCILFSFVLFLGFVFVAAAGDLGEAAKKEKARREELAKSGKKVTTFTNADVENLKATPSYEYSSEAPESEGTAGETAEQPAEETAPTAEEAAPTAEEAAPASDIDNQIEDLKNQKEEAEQEEQAARETVGQGGLFHSHNAGNQYQTAREAEDKAQEADEKAREAEEEKAKQEQEPE